MDSTPAAVYLPDLRLVREMRAGSRKAVAELLEAQAPRILVFFQQTLRTPEEAEDRLLDCLGDLAREAVHFDERRSLAVQSFAVALRFLDPPEPGRPGAGNSDHAATGDRPSWWPSRRHRPEAQDETTRLRRALGALPQRLRMPILLAEVAQLGESEIGELLFLEPRQVQALQHRARVAVAARLLRGQRRPGLLTGGGRANDSAPCSRVIENLSRWVRDELAAHEKTTVEHHLERCDDCSRLSESYRGVPELIGAALAPSPPHRLVAEQITRLTVGDGGTPNLRKPTGGTRRLAVADAGIPMGWRRYVGLALASVFILSLAVALPVVFWTQQSAVPVGDILTNHRQAEGWAIETEVSSPDADARNARLPDGRLATELAALGLNLISLRDTELGGEAAQLFVFSGQEDTVTLQLLAGGGYGDRAGAHRLDAQGVRFLVSQHEGTSIVTWRERQRLHVLTAAMAAGDLFALARSLVMR